MQTALRNLRGGCRFCLLYTVAAGVNSLIDLRQFELDVFDARFTGANRDGFVQQLLFHAVDGVGSHCLNQPAPRLLFRS